ncbi:MAG: hypothetical protein NCW75_04200 [Phycisphaera sp.]|nr:MAG: hypothetical protein NCW75_04200 [Phycisphaera sp.]
MTAQSNLDFCFRIDVLLEEYRALYGLAQFRMAALDRRVPLAGTALALSLGGAFVSPLSVQIVVLVVLPIAVAWLVRTTINHARSFEDALRRIEQIERHVNQIAGEPLLAFQSSHPSRGEAVGGRTGRESVLAVVLASTGSLVACLALVASLHHEDTPWRLLYLLVPVGTSVMLAHELRQLERYTYRTREARSAEEA